MTNLYKLDGIDLYGAFGFIAGNGSDDFLKLPTRKEPPSHNWPEDNNIDYDLSAPAYMDKSAVLNGHIIATSEADFWAKYQSLWALLSTPGQRIMEVVELAQSYKVFYKSSPLSKRLTRIKGATKIAVEVSLEFQVIDFAVGMEPGSNGGFVQIVNQVADVIAVVQAPGSYAIIEFSGIQDDGSGVYTNSIIDNS